MGLSDSAEVDVSDQDLQELDLITHDIPRSILRLFARRNRLRTVPPQIIQFTQLVELSLRDNLLREFPIEICSLTNLQKLSLSFNRIRVVPKAIGQLNKLLLLSLAANEIEHIPDEIGMLKMLVGLDIQRNRIRILPASIGKLQSLETILCQRNMIETIPDDIRNCSSLKSLNFSNNSIMFLSDAICDLNQLEELILSSNGLQILPPSLCVKLKYLKNLDCHTNSFSMMPKQIGEMTELRRLNFAINRINFIPIEIGKLRNLEWLNMNDNKIKEIPGSIANLQKLKKIGLVQNHISMLPNEIVLLSNLQKMDLRRNCITALPPTARFMKNVSCILITENPISSVVGREQHNLHGVTINQENKSIRSPNSLRELSARAVWSSVLYKNLLTCAMIPKPNDILEKDFTENLDYEEKKCPIRNQSENVNTNVPHGDVVQKKPPFFESQSANNRIQKSVTTEKTHNEMNNECIDALHIPFLTAEYLRYPSLCQVCLQPFCKESISYLFKTVLPGIDMATAPPLRFIICSETCVRRFETREHVNGIEKTGKKKNKTLNWLKKSRDAFLHANKQDSLNKTENRVPVSLNTENVSRSSSNSSSVRNSTESMNAPLSGSTTSSTTSSTDALFSIAQNGPLGYAWYSLLTGETLEASLEMGPTSAPIPHRWLVEQIREVYHSNASTSQANGQIRENMENF